LALDSSPLAGTTSGLSAELTAIGVLADGFVDDDRHTVDLAHAFRKGVYGLFKHLIVPVNACLWLKSLD